MRRAWLMVLATACTGDVCARPGVICTVAGVGGIAGSNGDGPAEDAWLYFPSGLHAHPEGGLVVADFNNQRIRRLTPEGDVVTLAGNGFHAYATVGAPARESSLENPVDASVGPDGALYIAELHGARILRVDEDGVIEAVAGTVGQIGFGGDGGDAERAFLSQIVGVEVDASGRVWIADTENHCVRWVEDGVIHRLAGDGVEGFVDGAAGRFHLPQRVAVGDDFLLVADAGNHAIRRVDLATGEVTTVVGTGVAGFDGDGGPAVDALLRTPYGVNLGADGSIWIADAGNHRVRQVTPDGVIRTVAGSGVEGFDGDGGKAVKAAMNFPVDVLPDDRGGIYVADMLNSVVRYVAGVQEVGR